MMNLPSLVALFAAMCCLCTAQSAHAALVTPQLVHQSVVAPQDLNVVGSSVYWFDPATCQVAMAPLTLREFSAVSGVGFSDNALCGAAHVWPISAELLLVVNGTGAGNELLLTNVELDNPKLIFTDPSWEITSAVGTAQLHMVAAAVTSNGTKAQVMGFNLASPKPTILSTAQAAPKGFDSQNTMALTVDNTTSAMLYTVDTNLLTVASDLNTTSVADLMPGSFFNWASAAAVNSRSNVGFYANAFNGSIMASDAVFSGSSVHTLTTVDSVSSLAVEHANSTLYYAAVSHSLEDSTAKVGIGAISYAAAPEETLALPNLHGHPISLTGTVGTTDSAAACYVTADYNIHCTSSWSFTDATYMGMATSIESRISVFNGMLWSFNASGLLAQPLPMKNGAQPTLVVPFQAAFPVDYMNAAIAFDAAEQRMYWTEPAMTSTGLSTIRSAFVNGTDATTLMAVEGNITMPNAIALDPTTGVVVFADHQSSDILSIPMKPTSPVVNGTGITTLYDDFANDGTPVTSICIDSASGSMFWDALAVSGSTSVPAIVGGDVAGAGPSTIIVDNFRGVEQGPALAINDGSLYFMQPGSVWKFSSSLQQ